MPLLKKQEVCRGLEIALKKVDRDAGLQEAKVGHDQGQGQDQVQGVEEVGAETEVGVD